MEANNAEIIIYQTEDGETKVEVQFSEETAWLSIAQMVELFGRDKSVISRHIKNIFTEGELEKSATVANLATVQKEGERDVERTIDYYNLDVIISVGYRVKSHRGTQFRIWATNRLKEYIIKGFAMDDERLKRGGGGNYFDELISRIRDIRSSEKVFWRKVLDIYATSVDYSSSEEISQKFFSTIQNKMHWASHQHTAAEIIESRADSDKAFMGLTSWEGKKIRKSDVGVAKNYLKKEEIEALNLIVSLFLDFAELQAKNRRVMYMKDWLQKLDDFLKISDREILTHAGKVSHDMALKKAFSEYEKYRKKEISYKSRVEIDFEKSVEKIKKLENGK